MLKAVGVALALLLLPASTSTLWAQAAPGVVDAITPGPASVDTAAGEAIGRLALSAYRQRLDPLVATAPDLDTVARDQLRAAITASSETGDLGPRLVHPAGDVLVRIGIVSSVQLDGRANLFSLDGPQNASSVGSAGGETVLSSPGADQFTAEVAAVAWRDPSIADAADGLSATYGPFPAAPDELNEAAAQRWLDQENRDRQASNFPAELLARRHAVLDREAENTMRRKSGEPELPPVVDPTGQVSLENKIHFTAYACSPNCEPFWTVPERAVDVLRQSSVEHVAAQSAARPELLDFQRYNTQLTWAVQLPRLPHYWNSYRMFGIAARVDADQEVAAGRDAARAAAESIAPGSADLWNAREYKVDMVVIAYDAWPTDWHRRP
jgi:hypothetical protein